MLELVFQGENFESDLWWLDPMPTMLERCFILEGVAVKQHRCPHGVKR